MTSSAPLPLATEPPVATAISGGGAHARRRTSRLLTDGGFMVHEPAPSSPPAVCLLILTDATDAERVGAVRRAGETYPDACILAIMPAGGANASLRRVLLAGASGIALDDDLERTLVPTARASLAGQLTAPPALGRQIAHKLFLAESTVKTHLASAFRKLDARSRSEAVTRIMDPETGYSSSILEITHDAVAAAG
jgi:Bacterial regulatory proteins, luxR family